MLQARAALLKSLRQFFESEGVLEVDTPLLYPFATSDPYINHLSVAEASSFSNLQFLQSSPEYAMKRLLCEHPVSMYQICKAFRGGENGSKHRSEFTMIEWYMVNYSLEQLMQQCEKLLAEHLSFQSAERISYQQAFINCLDVDPLSCSDEHLRSMLKAESSAENIESFSRDECLHLLFAEKVEKSFDAKNLVFVFDFPESQAALAQVSENQSRQKVAQRFEIYFSGMELANAYLEEKNASELRRRFKKENEIRKCLNKPEMPFDEPMLEAMKKFPNCSGIAMGLERLLLLKLNNKDIQSLSIF